MRPTDTDQSERAETDSNRTTETASRRATDSHETSDDRGVGRRRVLEAVGGTLALGGVQTARASSGASDSGTRDVSVTASGTYTDEYLDGVHYTKYVPSDATGGEPLVVMLHGCSQEPDEFAVATGMNAVAERAGFVAVYPDQSSFANAYDCWNWYYDVNTERGSGEGAAIVNIALNAVETESLNSDRVYVAGFSAGAAMVPNLLASYADVFAAGAIHSGLEYDAAETATGATFAMAYGGPDPVDQGYQAYDAMEAYGIAGRVPTIVFHGTDDGTVDDVNGDQARTQAAVTNDLAVGGVSTDPDDRTYGSTGGYNYRRDRHRDSDDRVVVEQWLVSDMGHDWAGGSPDGYYTAPDAPDASQAIWEFFQRW